MTTVSVLTDRIVNRLMGEQSVRIATIDGAVVTADSQITVDSVPAQLTEDAIVEIDNELLRVTGITGVDIDVLRGWDGSTAASHADDSIAYINPRFQRHQVIDIMKEELASWPIELGPIQTQELSFVVNQMEAELADDSYDSPPIRLLSAKALRFPGKTYNRRSEVEAVLVFDPDSSSFTTTGVGVQLLKPVNEAITIEVEYLTGFDVSQLDTPANSLEDDAQVDEKFIDILMYGTMYRLIATREVGRTAAAAQARHTAEQVPPTHILQVAENMKMIRDQRIADEQYRRHSKYSVLIGTMAT